MKKGARKEPQKDVQQEPQKDTQKDIQKDTQKDVQQESQKDTQKDVQQDTTEKENVNTNNTNFMMNDPTTVALLNQLKSMFSSEEQLEDFMTFHAKNKSEKMSIWAVVRNPQTGQIALTRLKQR